MQEAWGFIQCSQPLKVNANFGKMTIRLTDTAGDLDRHARLAEVKKDCRMLWLDMGGVLFTEALFNHLRGSA